MRDCRAAFAMTQEMRSAATGERHAKVGACMELGGAMNKGVQIACRSHVWKEEFEEMVGRLAPVDAGRHAEARALSN